MNILTLRVLRRDRWQCRMPACLCPDGRAIRRRRAAGQNDPWAPTADHIIPRSLGGPDTMGNLRAAHRHCNNARGAGALVREPG